MLPVVLAAGAVGALALFGGPKQVHANIFNDRTKAMVERWGSTFKEESFTEPASLGEMMSYKTQKVFAFPLYYRLATLVVASTAAVCLGGLLYMARALPPPPSRSAALSACHSPPLAHRFALSHHPNLL